MEMYEKTHLKKNPEDPEIHPIIQESNDLDVLQRPEVRLRKGILNNHLSRLQFQTSKRNPSPCLSVAENTKYAFAKTFRDLYFSEDHNIYETKENVDSNKYSVNNDFSGNHVKEKYVSDENSFVNSDNFSNNQENVRNEQFRKSNSEDSVTNLDWRAKPLKESPVWCMDYCNDLIILGCADGRLEFWEATSGKLKCVWWCMEKRACGAGGCGVTHVKALGGGRRVCVALLTGHLTLFRLDAYNAASGARVDWRFSTAYRRTHKRTGSADSLRSAHSMEDQMGRGRMSFSYEAENSDGEEVVCVRVAHCRPHQQPITELQSEGGRILTGGQDHVLKVFSSPDLTQLFTLHGHCGPITSCFIDHANPNIAGSGSQDGLLCVWDLHTGACLYSMQAHDGAVTSLTYTASYVVSAGADERLCIWDRFQGHMLNSIHIGLNYMSRMLPLTHTLLVMGDRSGLTAYDLSSGDIIRRVLFGQSDGCIFVRQILPLKDAIVCDYANQLRIVRFPLVSRLDMKSE